jgi:ATPase subunit of ABC transporter with duplicated ATPase domains
VVEFAQEQLRLRTASARVMKKACGKIHQYLGAFGLGGKHALHQIGKLFGGERMRFCFAKLLANEPHLLLMYESTNHVVIETLDSMSYALKNYRGSVLLGSHNQGFLSGFCQELWVPENDQVAVNHSDTETFDDIFAEDRNSVLQGDDISLRSRQQTKAERAKRATQQRSGTQQSTALL